VNDTELQSALPEWRVHMAQPASSASFLAATAILTLVDPFYTDESMVAFVRFDYWATARDLAVLAVLAVNIIVISAIFTILFHVPHHSTAKETESARARLVALSAEDHYMRISATFGEDLELMRLADAIREVGDTAGLQVRRPRWIATNHVTAATRKGDGAVLTLTGSPKIPVIRTNIAKIRAAGLLPRHANG
jgi:hypothetical protein